MRPRISMAAKPEIVLPGETLEVELVLGNPTEDLLRTALPSPDWWRGARLSMSRPDGASQEFLLSDTPLDGGGSTLLTIFDGAELAKAISLPMNTPGDYSIEGTLATSEGEEWPIPAVRWFVEKPHPMETAVPAVARAGEQDALSCWTLVRGERRSAVALRSIVRNDESRRERLELSAAEFLADVDSAAHGLVVTEASETPPRSAQWVAWLSGARLHAGVPFVRFETASIALPREARCILPHLVARPDGGADALVLAGDGLELWWLRLHPPEWIDDVTDSEDDERYPHPSELVTMRPPVIVGRHVLPAKFEQGVVSRAVPGGASGDAEYTAVAGLVQTGSCVEVHYAVFPAAGATPRWTSVAIDDALLIPGADASLMIDERGVGRVAVLVRVSTEGPQVATAVVAFDRAGQPLLTNGAGWRPYRLPVAAVRGAVALRFDADAREWLCHWCVILADGRCVLRRGGRAAEEVTLPGKIGERLTIASWTDECGVACETEEGWLRFVSV